MTLGKLTLTFLLMIDSSQKNKVDKIYKKIILSFLMEVGLRVKFCLIPYLFNSVKD